MAAFANFINPVVPGVSGNTFITCAGNVRAPHGAGVRRKVTVFMDNNLKEFIAETESTLPLGAFSVQVIAHPYNGLTVIASGVEGENSVINSHCRVF